MIAILVSGCTVEPDELAGGEWETEGDFDVGFDVGVGADLPSDAELETSPGGANRVVYVSWADSGGSRSPGETAHAWGNVHEPPTAAASERSLAGEPCESSAE